MGGRAPKARLWSWSSLCSSASLSLPWGFSLHTTYLPKLTICTHMYSFHLLRRANTEKTFTFSITHIVYPTPYLITYLPHNGKALLCWIFVLAIFLPWCFFPGAATLTDCQRRRNKTIFMRPSRGQSSAGSTFPHDLPPLLPLTSPPLFCKAMNPWLGWVRCKKELILRGRLHAAVVWRVRKLGHGCSNPTQTPGKKVCSSSQTHPASYPVTSHSDTTISLTSQPKQHTNKIWRGSTFDGPTPL